MGHPKSFIINRKMVFRLSSKPSIALFAGARSTGIAEVRTGWRQPLKTPDYLELFWCESGTFQFPLVRENRTVLLQPEQVLFLFPGDLHCQTVCSPRAKYFWVTFDGHAEEIVSMYHLTREPFHAGMPPEDLFLRLISELSHISPTMQYQASGMALEILHTALARKDSVREHEPVSEFCQRVESQFSSPQCTVELLAEQLHVSRVTLYRMILRAFGCTPKEYLDRSRLREAMKLLIGTHLSVREISRSCGFTYANYFSRLFRAKMGCSPESFRESGGGEASARGRYPR